MFLCTSFCILLAASTNLSVLIHINAAKNLSRWMELGLYIKHDKIIYRKILFSNIEIPDESFQCLSKPTEM